jgi:hypothetical protein
LCAFSLLSFDCSYHPLGFAYFPDGAHSGVDELEPGIAPPGSSSKCADDMSCPAPMYYIGDVYKGSYSNNPDLIPGTTDDDNFGLDDYEPLFFHPLPGKYCVQWKRSDAIVPLLSPLKSTFIFPSSEWIGYGEFSVYLKFDDMDFSNDIFYFCHVSNRHVSFQEYIQFVHSHDNHFFFLLLLDSRSINL